MTDHDYGEYFEWGLKNGEIIHVDKVENGLSCDCICPHCETPLIAYNRQGNKRANHFQHKSKTDCKNAYETGLHYLAKQIILETKTLTVPDINYHLSDHAEPHFTRKSYIGEKVKKQKLLFDSVELEKNEKYFRPDIKCIVKGKPLLIEIAVTHFVDEAKKKKIIANKTPLLEIDLSEIERDLHKQELTKALHGKISRMKWVHNPKVDERYRTSQKNSNLIWEYLEKNIKAHKVYGHDRNIYNCPRYKGHLEKIFVDKECLNCRCFVSETEKDYEEYEETPNYPEVFVNCVGHKKYEFDSLLFSLGIEIKYD